MPGWETASDQSRFCDRNSGKMAVESKVRLRLNMMIAKPSTTLHRRMGGGGGGGEFLLNEVCIFPRNVVLFLPEIFKRIFQICSRKKKLRLVVKKEEVCLLILFSGVPRKRYDLINKRQITNNIRCCCLEIHSRVDATAICDIGMESFFTETLLNS